MSTFDRIMKILDEITEVKSASVNPKADSTTQVGKYSEGAKARENDSMIKDYYPDNVPLPSTGRAPTKVTEATPSSMATFTGEDPANENTPVIKDMTTTLEKYKNKKTASLVDDSELIQDFVVVANDLLYTIVDDRNQQKAQPQVQPQNSVQKTAYVAPQQQSQKNDKNDIYTSDEFGAGVLYGITKQAEYHADLTAQYLYNLAKKAAEEDDGGTESADEEETPEPVEGETVEPEETEEEAKSEEGEEGEELSEDEAKKALEDMLSQSPEEEESGEDKGEPSEDDILQNLGMSLMELGITPEEFAGLGGPKAAKLASAFDAYRKKGKFKIEPANTWKKRSSRDYIKEYVVELINKNNR